MHPVLTQFSLQVMATTRTLDPPSAIPTLQLQSTTPTMGLPSLRSRRRLICPTRHLRCRTTITSVRWWGQRLRSGATLPGSEKAHFVWLCRAPPTQPPLLRPAWPLKTVFHCSTASTRGSACCQSSPRSAATDIICIKTCQSHETKPLSRAVTWSEPWFKVQKIVFDEFCLWWKLQVHSRQTTPLPSTFEKQWTLPNLPI